MNVYHVPRRFVQSSWGGTEQVILNTCKEQKNFGVSPKVLSSLALSGLRHETIDGIPVERFNYFYPYLGLSGDARKSLDMKGGNLFSFDMLRKLVSDDKPDLYHLHTGKRMASIIRWVAKRKNKPYIVSLHGGNLDIPEEEKRSFVEPTSGSFEWGKALGWFFGSRKVLDDASAIVCVGKKESELMQELYPNKRVVYLPNGVDCSKFARTRANRDYKKPVKRILCVGRIDPQKNQLLLIRTFAQLKQSNPELELILVGHVTNNDYYNTLINAIRDLRLEKSVQIIPGLPNDSEELHKQFEEADLFCLPSIHEPFGIVTLEAWASGLPVVAANVGGLRNLVEHNKDGLLFESNSQSSLEHAMLQVMNDDELRARFAKNGVSKTLSEYDWTSLQKELLKIYMEVLDEHSLCA